MSTFLSLFSLAMALSFSSPEESKDSSSCWELPANRERLLGLLADLVSSLGVFLGDLERSLLDELYLDLERLEDLLDLDHPLDGSLLPELDLWRLALLIGDLET